MKNSKVRFITLGCKVNQYETQAMREAMGRAGVSSFTPASPSEEVDFVVVNTCTVTAEADKENKYWIRRARREHPNARIVVTGCGVERNRAQYDALAEVDLILFNHEKAGIAQRLLAGCASPAAQDEASLAAANPRHLYTPLSISETDGGGRAFVKIQDGCNHACSFCKVVMVRGRSRSRGLAEIVDEMKRLRDSGYREIVFAGIQLGAYGLDFGKDFGAGLVEVLEAGSRIEGIERLRLSSIEPTDVRACVIEAMRDLPKCCPQLHIPLQSGDDEILASMNRRYGRDFYIDLVAKLKSELTEFNLTLDVMAGFPGEEEKHFQNTLDLLEDVKPLKCHVFPYSRREGTRAARFEDLQGGVIKDRVKALTRAGERLGREVRLPYLGRTVSVLIESEKAGFLQGMTSNYLKVELPGSRDRIGQIVPVKLLSLGEDIFLGAITGEDYERNF